MYSLSRLAMLLPSMGCALSAKTTILNGILHQGMGPFMLQIKLAGCWHVMGQLVVHRCMVIFDLLSEAEEAIENHQSDADFSTDVKERKRR